MNLLAVLAAAVVNMVIGSLWYSPAVFGHKWMQLVGLKPEAMTERSKSMGPTYGIMFVGSLVMAYVLSRILGMMPGANAMTGASTGFLAWLGFTAPTHLANYLFEGKSTSLYGINVGYFLVSLVLMGALLGAWR